MRLVVKFTRRRFLMSLPLLGGGALGAASLLEPNFIESRRLDMRELGLGKRIVQFSDLHHRGDLAFGRKVVDRIHALKPDYVVFTGDLVEHRERTHLKEALELIASFEVPVYGIVGNHDPIDRQSLAEYGEAYAATGGRFLFGERAELDGFVLHGSRNAYGLRFEERRPKLLLCHYPMVGQAVRGEAYDLILAGHSHGGQVRLPLLGAVVLPPGVGRYERGYYETPAGSLYVNVGVGTYLLPMRLFCRPEITEILI